MFAFSELDAVLFDERLLKLVAKNVGKTINLFTVKCESVVSFLISKVFIIRLKIATDASAYQIIDSNITANQALNFEIANCLIELTSSISVSLVNQPPSILAVIQETAQAS